MMMMDIYGTNAGSGQAHYLAQRWIRSGWCDMERQNMNFAATQEHTILVGVEARGVMHPLKK